MMRGNQKIDSQKIESGAVLKPKILSKFFYYKGLIYLKIFQQSLLDSADFINLDIASTSFMSAVVLESSFSKKSNTELAEKE